LNYLTTVVFQWFPLNNLITVKPVYAYFQGVCLISSVYFETNRGTKTLEFCSYFVSSCTQLFEVITCQVWNAWLRLHSWR